MITVPTPRRRHKNIRPRFGAVHRYGSIAVIERFIKSLKDEWLRRLVIPLRLESMRADLSAYASWFNEHRPHRSLDGRTPLEVYDELVPASQRRSVEPRANRLAHRAVRLTLSVSYHEGRRHLPIIELKQAV